ncbi:TetR/AcrR family transcriptional regulator [Bailinhaonella thermotolerans]|uniref:TetR/AcrR family transcriptional regulator n=1 Tax=Bailinhaonella thermotolerans TaxID=1070861 RepID=UPI001F5B0306|nr:TetR/AcrR family transcriptional regulator [Bailinhaonella thermotolerans]
MTEPRAHVETAPPEAVRQGSADPGPAGERPRPGRAARPEPRRETKGDRTRARILDSATELFSRSGFHAVSLRDIAAHAGLTHAGLLHHFPGKESLLIQVLARRDEVDGRLMAGPDARATPEELLDRAVAQVARNMRSPGLVALYVKISGEAADPEHPAHDYFVHRYRRLRRDATWLLGELFRRADPPVPHDPAVAARELIALVDGLQTQWLLEPEEVDMREVVLAFLAQLGVHPANPGFATPDRTPPGAP